MKRFRIPAHAMPTWVAVALFGLIFTAGSLTYTGFFSGQVILNLLIDNAFLLVVAVGVTFVILSGGIDLSVGSVVALTTMLLAWGTERSHWPVALLVPALLILGTLFGAAMGWIVQVFRVPAFIVTLAGMFLARGLCYLISIDSISISDPTLTSWAQARLPVPGVGEVSPGVVVALLTLAFAIWLGHATAFGRAVYALGGNERSASLMGLPVARTRVAVYAMSGFCAALGGVLFGVYTLSGYGLHAQGLELDAIAAAVIGGALLTGGVGYVAGTLTGVLILGVIQSLITFDGTLSSWWARIMVGALLGFFCIFQRVFAILHRSRAGPTPAHATSRPGDAANPKAAAGASRPQYGAPI